MFLLGNFLYLTSFITFQFFSLLENRANEMLYAIWHMVSVEGVEPSILSAAELKSDVYANSTTRPNIKAAIYTCRAASPRSEAYIIEKPSA